MALVVKNPPANAGDIKDLGSVSGLGLSPGGGRGNPFQYSCLEKPMDRGAWWATVHRVPGSWTWLKRFSPAQHSLQATSWPSSPHLSSALTSLFTSMHGGLSLDSIIIPPSMSWSCLCHSAMPLFFSYSPNSVHLFRSQSMSYFHCEVSWRSKLESFKIFNILLYLSP